jgi:hypothetical protein
MIKRICPRVDAVAHHRTEGYASRCGILDALGGICERERVPIELPLGDAINATGVKLQAFTPLHSADLFDRGLKYIKTAGRKTPLDV